MYEGCSADLTVFHSLVYFDIDYIALMIQRNKFILTSGYCDTLSIYIDHVPYAILSFNSYKFVVTYSGRKIYNVHFPSLALESTSSFLREYIAETSFYGNIIAETSSFYGNIIAETSSFYGNIIAETSPFLREYIAETSSFLREYIAETSSFYGNIIAETSPFYGNI